MLSPNSTSGSSAAIVLNQDPKPVGRPLDYAQRIAEAQTQVERAEHLLKSALARRTQAQEAVRGISHSYHPFDLKTGAAQGPEAVSRLEMTLLATTMTKANVRFEEPVFS